MAFFRLLPANREVVRVKPMSIKSFTCEYLLGHELEQNYSLQQKMNLY